MPERDGELPHAAEIAAIQPQIDDKVETHLYLTDYGSLYVGQLGEVTADAVLEWEWEARARPRTSISAFSDPPAPLPSGPMNILIVESAAKGRTLQRYLGDGWRVLATGGHVQTLPRSRRAHGPGTSMAFWASRSGELSTSEPGS